MTPMPDLRPHLTEYLQQRVVAFRDGFRHNLAVLGPPGSGKSQVVLQALQAARPTCVIIGCALERMSIQEFVKQFSMAVLRGATGETADLSCEALLERASAVAPKTVEAVVQLRRAPAGHMPADTFIHALDLVPLVHRELGRPCVLVLDEFLHLGELGVSHVFHELGKRVVTWPNVMFLVTSSSMVQARDILRERLQLLFGQFEFVTLGPVETPAAMAWMRTELPGSSEREDLLRFLLHWMSDSAWQLHVFVTRMKELMLLKRQERISEQTLFEGCWDVLGSRHGVLHQRYAAVVERVACERHGALARDALLAIACGARTTHAIAQRCGGRRTLSQALQVLVQRDLVHRKGSCWVIPDQVFGCWLAWICAPRGLRGPDEPSGAQQCMQEALCALWTSWLTSTNRPLAERISGLLSQFGNEMVSLDHKTGKLPLFQRMTTTGPAQLGGTYILAEGLSHRWCCLVHDGKLEEAGIAAFERFCRTQSPKPSRKVVVANEGLDLNAKLLAKEANMWVWEHEDLRLLGLLYGSVGKPA